jgi:hypothetical protein
MSLTKKRGSWFWLIIWLLVFWPGAIVYAIVRDWSRKPKS